MGGGDTSAVRYRIDAGRSRFVVRAFAEGLLSAFGHSPTVAVCGFGGDVRLVPDTLRQASLLVLVQSGSLSVVGEIGERDRREMERTMREEVLETARYPEIVFLSTEVSAGQAADGEHLVVINGDLSLHGVTRPHRLEARVTFDGTGLRARGEFPLRQSDYNIRPVSVAAGTLKVKDELRLSFDIAAEKG